MNLLASSPHLIMFYRKNKNIVNISCAAHIQASFFLSGEPNLSGLCNKEALHILCKLVICTGSRIHTTQGSRFREAQLRFPFHPSFLILKMQQLLPLFPRLSLYPFGCAICLPFLYFAFARRQMERGSNDAELRSPGREEEGSRRVCIACLHQGQRGRQDEGAFLPLPAIIRGRAELFLRWQMA